MIISTQHTHSEQMCIKTFNRKSQIKKICMNSETIEYNHKCFPSKYFQNRRNRRHHGFHIQQKNIYILLNELLLYVPDPFDFIYIYT